MLDKRYFSSYTLNMLIGDSSMARLRVREVAKEKGVNATELARQSRIAYSAVLKMFNNPEYNATLETLEAVARVLGVRVTELIEDESPQK
jgi:DNA-binding Xre family transcriptional regulator